MAAPVASPGLSLSFRRVNVVSVVVVVRLTFGAVFMARSITKAMDVRRVFFYRNKR